MGPILFVVAVVLVAQLGGLAHVRLLAEAVDVSASTRGFDDTVRADPLNGLKEYRGGYDITNKHYWSSTSFTGIHGYAIGVLWVLCGVGYGGFLVVRATCKRGVKINKRAQSCHEQCYGKPLAFFVILLFTLLAITASGLVLGGNEKFHSRAKTVVDIIIDTADEASHTIYNATRAMKFIRGNLADANASSHEASAFLTSTSRRLDSQASEIARQARRNRRLIDIGLRIVYIVTTATVSLTLVAATALIVLGLLNFKRTLHVVIAICWTLTALCWLLFGVYFFLQNFAGDTCTALESFQQDPHNNSLSSILPCDALLSARSVLSDVSTGVYDLVNEVNENISTSYGNIVQICNPFSEPPLNEYQPWNCPASAIRIGDIPEVLRKLACPDSEGAATPTACNGGILIPANYYYTVDAYSTSLQRLLDVYPGMESLVECQTVKDAFSEIIQNHCGPLRRYVRMVWASFVFLSVVMVALVFVWAVGANLDCNRNRNRNHICLGASKKPHSTTTPDHMLESGTPGPDPSTLHKDTVAS